MWLSTRESVLRYRLLFSATEIFIDGLLSVVVAAASSEQTMSYAQVNSCRHRHVR
jgi:hypothetical protein